jgi:hypothetical protein
MLTTSKRPGSVRNSPKRLWMRRRRQPRRKPSAAWKLAAFQRGPEQTPARLGRRRGLGEVRECANLGVEDGAELGRRRGHLHRQPASVASGSRHSGCARDVAERRALDHRGVEHRCALGHARLGDGSNQPARHLGLGEAPRHDLLRGRDGIAHVESDVRQHHLERNGSAGLAALDQRHGERLEGVEDAAGDAAGERKGSRSPIECVAASSSMRTRSPSI